MAGHPPKDQEQREKGISQKRQLKRSRQQNILLQQELKDQGRKKANSLYLNPNELQKKWLNIGK